MRNRHILLVTDNMAVDEEGRSTRKLFAEDKRARAARIVVEATITIESPSPGRTIDTKYFTPPPDSTGVRFNVMVVDLADHGLRSGPVPTVLIDLLRSAVERSVPVVVLDRPNPLTGDRVEGPAADSASALSDKLYGLPPRHGLTVGELAKWLNETARIGAFLTVIPVRGWRRDAWPSDAGIRPPQFGDRRLTPEQLILLGACGIFRATNVVCQAGPSRTGVEIAAPWLDSRAAAKTLGDRLIPAVEFSFGPATFSAPMGTVLHTPALRVSITDRDRASGIRIMAAVLATLRKQHPDALTLDPPQLRRITGGFGFGEAILAGDDSDAIVDRDLANIIAFQRRVKPFQLYR